MRFLVRVSAPLSCSHEGMVLKESNPKASPFRARDGNVPKVPEIRGTFSGVPRMFSCSWVAGS